MSDYLQPRSSCWSDEGRLHYSCHRFIENTIEELISTLEKERQAAIHWFASNNMIVNPDKFQAIFVKVACVVNIKLGFMDQLFCNFIMLIKLCKIQYWNFDKALAFPRNQIICLKNWKPWWTPTGVKFNILGWIFAHVSPYECQQKSTWDFFFCFVYFVLELLINLVLVSV